MTSENWTVYFANLLRRQWRDHYLPGDPPFAPAKGDEALTYTNLPTEDRYTSFASADGNCMVSQPFTHTCPPSNLNVGALKRVHVVAMSLGLLLTLLFCTGYLH